MRVQSINHFKFPFFAFAFGILFLDCKRSGLICYRHEKILRLIQVNAIQIILRVAAVEFSFIALHQLVCATKTGSSRNLLRAPRSQIGDGEGGEEK